MSKAGSPAPEVQPSATYETGSVPAAAPEARVELETASQDALFAVVAASLCDACGDPLPEGGAEDHDDEPRGYGLPGAGVYMWTRGLEVRLESAPLCPSCASAIGMTALARWEIEEEEG
jgi:hypothetical protein